MNINLDQAILDAADILHHGGIIAYPTEAVYGLGCDPFNQLAVNKLLALKNRSVDQGLILIGSSWQTFEELVEPISPPALARVLTSWPGPTTWIFPAQMIVPNWIRGKHKTVAIRVTDHPVVQKLCKAFGGPITSTSANVGGFPPIRSRHVLDTLFKDKVDYFVPGELGSERNPSQIRDAISGETLRKN